MRAIEIFSFYDFVSLMTTIPVSIDLCFCSPLYFNCITSKDRFAEDGLLVLILKIKTQKHFNAYRYSKAIELMAIFYLSPSPSFQLENSIRQSVSKIMKCNCIYVWIIWLYFRYKGFFLCFSYIFNRKSKPSIGDLKVKK